MKVTWQDAAVAAGAGVALGFSILVGLGLLVIVMGVFE